MFMGTYEVGGTHELLGLFGRDGSISEVVPSLFAEDHSDSSVQSR